MIVDELYEELGRIRARGEGYLPVTAKIVVFKKRSDEKTGEVWHDAETEYDEVTVCASQITSVRGDGKRKVVLA